MRRALPILLAILLVPAIVFGGGRERNVEKSFDLDPGGTVKITMKCGGDIRIEGWDENRAEAVVRITGTEREDVDVDFDRKRRGLEIEIEANNWMHRCRADADIVLRVPRETDIEFSSYGGDIACEGIEGRLTGRTLGGDMTFSRIDGTIRMTTYGGDVEVADSRVDGKVKTLGGDVRIERVVGDLTGSTLGGDVTYTDVTGGGGKGHSPDRDVSITSMGGDLDVDYPARDVTLRTMGGNIDVGRAEKVNVTTMGGDIRVNEAPVGASVMTMGGDIHVGSAGGFCKAKTMGGDIELDAVDGWISAVTMGGDVEVTMVGDPGEGKRDVELKSMGGDIELTVPPGLSMEFDVEIAYTKNHRRECRIESDFDMKIERTTEWKRKWGQKRKYIYGTGEVNGGEHRVKIRTINGNVIIRKGD
ncbi:MAG: DUF4097 family beta strand repeat protein [Candidatus Krumholzibacteriota bacterium]|nr:DUF4097 family beta strand repeat protein [Candidatus Krumholzibacteriota bacterium]